MLQSDLAQFLESLKRDVATTVGSDHIGKVDDLARFGRTFITDRSWLGDWLVQAVQQCFHDTRVDTTWPACPRHPHHPLWFEVGSWRCERDAVVVCGLGELASIAKTRQESS